MENNQDHIIKSENEEEEEFLNLSILPETNVSQCNIDDPGCESCQ